MDGEQLRMGKERVRTVLIEPLEPLGLSRPKDLKVVQFEKMLDRIPENLAYMSRDGLYRLRLVVEANLAGKNGDQWPAPAAIYKWASAIEAEPAGETRLVISWLTSIEGPMALAGGYIVELRSDLRKFRCPPTKTSLANIKQRAQDNQRRCVRIRENRSIGRASPGDLAWLDAYETAQRACADIVGTRSKTEAAG